MGAILPPACSAIRISSVDPPVEYLLVRYADVGFINVPSHLADEQVMFLSDIFPTAISLRISAT